MKNIKAKSILNRCLNKIQEMSQQEFNDIILDKGINQITYDIDKYIRGNFTLNIMTEVKEFDQEINGFGYDANQKCSNDKIIITQEEAIEDCLCLAA
ncbi:hypothetical protein P5F52_14920 [Clostridium perfringens]|uniref:hypothetical protein n=1 Tax=Clostridium perfringens TaxID=1502 RepID=UPI0039ECA852|nr:hypothetical protein [Clostridium perfringens]